MGDKEIGGKLEPLSEFKSIRELKSINKGGVYSRIGFTFQDHIAVGFCLQMLTDLELSEVWCESHDDITLIWQKSGVEEVEFIQVKDLDFDQFWTASKLCERDTSHSDIKIGTSILEKSLLEDRCAERTKFRLITSVGVKNELDYLCLPFTSPERRNNKVKKENLLVLLNSKVGNNESVKGNDIEYWINNTLWEIEYSSQAIQNKNITQLSKTLSLMGYEIPLIIIENDIYPSLLQLVREAAEIDPDIEPEKKRILHNQFINQITMLVQDLEKNDKANAGKKLIDKMEKAGLSDYVSTALEQRRMYRSERLDPQYLELSDRELIDGEVLSTLQALRLQLDFGKIEPGLTFYSYCIDKLRILNTSISTKTPSPQYYIEGCMHDIVDRCQHRYHRE